MDWQFYFYHPYMKQSTANGKIPLRTATRKTTLYIYSFFTKQGNFYCLCLKRRANIEETYTEGTI